MPEIERYNTRNVAQKEIYDSYMGILRISPNELNGSDVDDPTQFLNVLYDEEKKERMKIILSDSDGNVLPIQFQPRAFQQIVSLPNKTTNISTDTPVDVINISTIINDGKGTLFVANNFNLRSTLHISPEFENLEKSKHSKLKIYSGGESSSSKQITARGVLLYPTESPNDGNYFNDKNKLNLFSTSDNTPRYKQVDKKLLSYNKNWHDTLMPRNERVKISGKVVSQPNDLQEEVPVYYTRDYILGHYDGHQLKTKVDNITSQTWGENGNNSEGLTDYITKLSWTRFDKLIWDSLEEIIQGKVRHTKGRYDELGIDMGADGIREQLGLIGHNYKNYAPILGTEMAKGMIVYHAMPFHRYWFHRTKQALRGFIERKKSYLIHKNEFENIYPPKTQNSDNAVTETNESQDLDKIIIDTNLLIDDGDECLDKELVVKDEIEKLSQYYNDGILTPNPMGTIGFANSLSKNFVLCNGKEVSFKNFPNISLSNETFFELNEVGTIQYDSKLGFKTIPLHKSNDENSNLTVMGALANTSKTQLVRLPNLFALYESSPRFIRGLNWTCENDESSLSVNVYNPTNSTNKTDYVKSCKSINKTPLQFITEVDYKLQKNINDASKVHFHTFDHLIEKETHQHNMFSKNQGGSHNPIIDRMLHHYHCRNTRGHHKRHVYRWLYMEMMNYDKTCSELTPLNVNTSTKDFNIYYSDENRNVRWKSECQQFLKYCMGGIYNGGYHNGFTPIPNVGLFIFNYSIFNNQQISQFNPDVTKDLSNYHYRDANQNKHYLKEAKITNTSFNESNFSKIKDYVKILKTHDGEIQRRKFWAMKANEAEGYIPISYTGKAGGKITLSWSRDERHGISSSSRNTYEDKKYNVASYIMTPCNNYDENKSFWRCWSSIAYLNSNKLGVGDVENYVQNTLNYNEDVDYYDVNCVTQLPNEEKQRIYSYGGINLSVNESCPTPSHMNLLPLLRI